MGALTACTGNGRTAHRVGLKHIVVGIISPPYLILEAVTSYDTWIWHVFFRVLRACNDLNVLAPLFDELTVGRAHQVLYQVNKIDYNLCYYLIDAIYPRWAFFVKSIPRPALEKDILFSKCQEGYRMDVERCFSILQS